jgi:hypothetical protein
LKKSINKTAPSTTTTKKKKKKKRAITKLGDPVVTVRNTTAILAEPAILGKCLYRTVRYISRDDRLSVSLESL